MQLDQFGFKNKNENFPLSNVLDKVICIVVKEQDIKKYVVVLSCRM